MGGRWVRKPYHYYIIYYVGSTHKHFFCLTFFLLGRRRWMLGWTCIQIGDDHVEHTGKGGGTTQVVVRKYSICTTHSHHSHGPFTILTMVPSKRRPTAHKPFTRAAFSQWLRFDQRRRRWRRRVQCPVRLHHHQDHSVFGTQLYTPPYHHYASQSCVKKGVDSARAATTASFLFCFLASLQCV